MTACLTELVVPAVGVVYLAVRSTLVSYEFVDPSKAGRRLRALAVVAISAVVAVANAVRNWNTYGDRYTGLLDGHFLAVPVVTFLACGALLSWPFSPWAGPAAPGKSGWNGRWRTRTSDSKTPRLPEDFRPTAARGVLV